MDQSLCRLTLISPAASAERVIEIMLDLDPPIPGFTTWDAEGHGFGFANANPSERVRGRVKRTLITSILGRAEADFILGAIAEQAPIEHLAFWIEPVERFGQLQETQSPLMKCASLPAKTPSGGQ
jgi:hypothetical protein